MRPEQPVGQLSSEATVPIKIYSTEGLLPKSALKYITLVSSFIRYSCIPISVFFS